MLNLVHFVLGSKHNSCKRFCQKAWTQRVEGSKFLNLAQKTSTDPAPAPVAYVSGNQCNSASMTDASLFDGWLAGCPSGHLLYFLLF